MVLPCGKNSVKQEKTRAAGSDLTAHVLQDHLHSAPLCPQVGGVDPVSDVTDALGAADFTDRRAWYEGMEGLDRK